MDFNEDMYTEEELAFREEMHEKILDRMAEKDFKPARYKELKNYFEIDDEDDDKFLALLNEMEDEVSIVKTKNNRYMLPPDNAEPNPWSFPS